MLPPVPTLPTTTTRLAQAADIGDLRLLARRRAPRMVFDYVDVATESERSFRASVEAFHRVTFRPRVLRDVGTVFTSTDVLGRSIALPLVLGPMGFTRMTHRAGESAVASRRCSGRNPLHAVDDGDHDRHRRPLRARAAVAPPRSRQAPSGSGARGGPGRADLRAEARRLLGSRW
ncbi:alpha-hydroxy-acid oxidizing protein [Modestobacter sp. VKM Ac-2981]|uniref:alpha-hydroxy-acid oxidizing protein n=1 Tax=unclassified Modestobacter TaxID=2643866 RepID=UPI003FA5F5B5